MRYILSKKKGITTFGYKVMSQGQKVFIDAQEVDLAQHVKEQANKFCDASAAPCRLLAFQFAEKKQRFHSWTKNTGWHLSSYKNVCF